LLLCGCDIRFEFFLAIGVVLLVFVERAKECSCFLLQRAKSLFLVDSVLCGDLIEWVVEVGLCSLFVGFEILILGNLVSSNKCQNLGCDYMVVIDRLYDLGVMINGSFVFGMDDDEEDVFW